jgi:hypothetical protein
LYFVECAPLGATYLDCFASPAKYGQQLPSVDNREGRNLALQAKPKQPKTGTKFEDV